MVGIYKITSPSGRVYVGQSTNIEKRFAEYRGLRNCKVSNVLDLDADTSTTLSIPNQHNNKYDTILLLMNGTGIFGKMNQISKFLQKLKSLLKDMTAKRLCCLNDTDIDCLTAVNIFFHDASMHLNVGKTKQIANV